ncbi:MAG: HDOD domain-containing protein [Candidatus Zixiibacteriota bacterium]
MTTQLIDSGIEEKIISVIGGVNNLPTPPIVFSQIQKVLNNPNTSAFDIAAILQEDPAISAKVLKLTNSAYYGLAKEIESVRQAVVIVGLEAIKNLVLSASIFEAFSNCQLDKEFQDTFWRHSLGTAFAARLFAYKLRANMGFEAESAFSAGMLHDIGKMVISVFMRDEAKWLDELKEQKPDLPDHALEQEVLGYNHAQIGSLLARQWILPHKLQETIMYHHFPQLAESDNNNLPYLIHISDYLAHYTFDFDPEEEEEFKESLQDGVLNYVGTSLNSLLSFSPSLREEYSKSETFLEMAKGL